MNTEDKQLERLLRSQEEPYIDDAGFTGRVMAGLPVGRQSRRLRRGLLLGLACAVSLCVAGLLGGSEIYAAVSWFTLEPVLYLGSLGFSVASVLALGAGLVLAARFTLLSLNFLGDGLRDALDVRSAKD